MTVDEHEHEHLPGCPAAISVTGARDECRCSELARFFRVPPPEECFGDQDAERGRRRWEAARRDAAARYARLMRELMADERAALARLRATAADGEIVERDIAIARRLLEQYRTSSPHWP